MATVIRLTRRGGRKKKPFYHVVVIDSRSRRDGRSVDEIGTYDPLISNGCTLNKEKAVDWMKKGARPSQTVKSLFVKSGIIEKAAQ